LMVTAPVGIDLYEGKLRAIWRGHLTGVGRNIRLANAVMAEGRRLLLSTRPISGGLRGCYPTCHEEETPPT
jgi:hypothetical protein